MNITKTIVIPARYASKRFPGKALALIEGIPMIIRVYKRLESLKKKLDCKIWVVTDDKRIYDVVDKYGYNCKMTKEHKSGTDRVYEFSTCISSDIYINVQGDEPLVNPEDVEKVIFAKEHNMGCIVGSMAFINIGEMQDETIVKVKINEDGFLTDITRKPISTIYRQCGIYAYTKQELKQFYYSCANEVEGIELTRWCNEIKMVRIKGSHAVDMPEDLEKIKIAIQRGERL